MLKFIVLGGGFAFAAAIQPGPLQAFLLSRVVTQGWRRTLPAALAPVLSDGPIAVLVLLVLRTMAPAIQRGLRVAGGVYLLALAWSAFVEARASKSGATIEAAAPRTLREAVVVNLLNPNPYLGWAFVLGPAAMAAWAESALYAAGFVASFYVTMTATLAAFIAACGSATLLPPRTRRVLMLVSAAALAALGAWQLGLGIAGT